jgi:hypothetical protein
VVETLQLRGWASVARLSALRGSHLLDTLAHAIFPIQRSSCKPKYHTQASHHSFKGSNKHNSQASLLVLLHLLAALAALLLATQNVYSNLRQVSVRLCLQIPNNQLLRRLHLSTERYQTRRRTSFSRQRLPMEMCILPKSKARCSWVRLRQQR